MALVITGLILFLPANFLPILKLEIMGNFSYHTMFSAVVSIYQGGLEVYMIALLVAVIKLMDMAQIQADLGLYR